MIGGASGENQAHLSSVNSHADKIQNKHKKNKSQLSFTTSGETSAKVSSLKAGSRGYNQGNFGPVHFHNNSGGVTGNQDMMLDSNGNIVRQVSDQILSQQVSVNEEPNRSDDFANENQSNIITSTFSIKPLQKKPKATLAGLQQKSANANISQSSVISNNTNHKNSLFEEASVSDNAVVNFRNAGDGQQPQKVLGSVDGSGS